MYGPLREEKWQLNNEKVVLEIQNNPVLILSDIRRGRGKLTMDFHNVIIILCSNKVAFLEFLWCLFLNLLTSKG